MAYLYYNFILHKERSNLKKIDELTHSVLLEQGLINRKGKLDKMRRRTERKATLVIKAIQGNDNTIKLKVSETYFENTVNEQKHLELRNIINSYDPMFMLWAAPENEYEVEIEMIIEGIDCKMDKEEVINLVCRIFYKQFFFSCEKGNSWISSEGFHEMTSDIYNWMLYGH